MTHSMGEPGMSVFGKGGSNLLRIMRSAGEAHCLVRGWDRLVLSEGARGFDSGGHILKW